MVASIIIRIGAEFKKSNLTLKTILKFSAGWIIGTTIFTLLTQQLAGWPPFLNFYLSIENILIYLVFESIIMGISEEIVFRGLVYGTLSPYFSKKVKIGFSISYAGIINALFFAIAHVGFQFLPFAITTFSPMKIFVAFPLGFFMPFFVKKLVVYWAQSWRIIFLMVGFPSFAS